MRTLAALLGGLGVGLLAGAALSHAEASLRAKKHYQEEYEETAATLERVYQFRIARAESKFWKNVDNASVVDDENYDLNEYSFQTADDDPITVGGEITIETPIATPDYVAAATQYGDQETFASDVSPWSLEFIEEEDYQDDDHRSKEQIVILMGGSDDEPLFMMDGHQIDNWAELVGDYILKEFYQRCPPGADRVLYVRNHARDEDYEVIQEMP